MTGLLKNNFIAMVLLGTAGFVLLLGLLMQLTSGIDLDRDGSTEGGVLAGEHTQQGLSLPAEIEKYAVIGERPLFNTSRRPIALEDPAPAEDFDASNEVQPLNAALTGVVIVDDRMIVVLQDNDSKQFVRTSLGEGMDGVFADWRVEKIGPRSVTLTSFAGESIQLDMQVAQTTAPPPAATPQASSAQDNQRTAREKYQQAIMDAGKDNNNESRAEEIRRRIAERRAQLQAAADKKAVRQNGKLNYDK